MIDLSYAEQKFPDVTFTTTPSEELGHCEECEYDNPSDADVILRHVRAGRVVRSLKCGGCLVSEIAHLRMLPYVTDICVEAWENAA